VKRDVLTRPFETVQIKRRQGAHGKELSYVDVATVVARLNEAADFEWSFEVVKHEILVDEVIVLGKLTIDGVTKMAFGGSSVTRDNSGKEVSLADDLKAGTSDAIKKTASLFGIGLEMYGGTPERQPASSTGRATNGSRPQAAPVADRVTARQLSAIQSACRRKGVSRDELGTIISRTGKSALQFLTRGEASAILTELDGQGNGTQAPFNPQ
jgi:Rad52/22 family double-strand break repair protein